MRYYLDTNILAFILFYKELELAEAFYLTHDIEKYGSGFIRIREAIAVYPTMVFDFRNLGDGFETRFSYTEQKINSDNIMPGYQVNQIGYQVNETGGTTEKTGGTTDTQSAILLLIKQDNTISINKLSAIGVLRPSITAKALYPLFAGKNERCRGLA
ncbi:MAG: hypothetical protein LBG96_03130 [Tannerella sp.]|jgi:predicted HTH transcriptional regulator|nr:hypothetical protein [Tannerella sp.]